MTKIYIYCLFERDGALHGVYSSLKAAHRMLLNWLMLAAVVFM